MHTKCAALISAAALLWACERDAELPTASPTPDVAQHPLPTAIQKRLKVQLERFSTMPMLLTADRLGVTEVRGKSIKPKKKDRHNGPRKKLTDVPIAADPNADENEPTVAANPKKKKLLVAGSHFITDVVRCEARHSSDGGRNWSALVLMPQLTAESQCSDPVLTYSPDGKRVFYAYMDIKFFPTFDFDILVSYSTDDGATWIGPFIALDGVGDVLIYDKPWIGTPADASNYVYVTATRFNVTDDCQIVFARSTNGGAGYGAPQTLDLSAACGEGTSPLVQGSRPSGGKRGNVLVGWYNSGTDGVNTGSFNIRTRHSADFGATFEPVVDAATDASEANFFLGPSICYEVWEPVMYPDVEIDASGRGHIAYTHDPAAGNATAEEGDIRYITSKGPPYTSWSRPITVNDDGTVSAQGFVALDVKSAEPHATWVDHRLPLEKVAESQCPFVPDVENLEYDIFSSTRQAGGWSPNVRVTEQSSLSDYLFLGDYIDLSADARFTIWTDRRDKVSIFDPEDDIWGSRTHRVQPRLAVGAGPNTASVTAAGFLGTSGSWFSVAARTTR
jgi:hypothetical protein